MARRAFPLTLFAAWFLLPCAAAAADPTAGVRAVLTARCAPCHSPGLRRPKGKFGYVTDLKRLAENPKLVVPSKPEESGLWRLVDEDKMPPEDGPVGPLSAAEKGTIRDWIADGAPSGVAAPTEAPAPPRAEEPLPARPLSRRLFAWIGKFHVVIIHFPIALLMAAAAGEAWAVWRRKKGPWAPVQFCAGLGAAAAVVAASLGWLHADVGGYGEASPLLAPHRWLGTAAAAWSVGVALLAGWDVRRGERSWKFRVALWVGAALVGAAGHFGGGLVHGEDFFAW